MRTAPAQNVRVCVCVYLCVVPAGRMPNNGPGNAEMALAAAVIVAVAAAAAAAKGRRRKLLRKGQLNCIKFNNFCAKANRTEP